MDDYAKVRVGKLKMKGIKRMGDAAAAKKQKKMAKLAAAAETDPDRDAHGGWRAVKTSDDLKAMPVCFECEDGKYMASGEDGYLKIGPAHDPGTEPFQHEIFMMLKAPDSTEVSFKNCYGLYLSADVTDFCSCQAEAVGTNENWKILFREDGKAILKSQTGKLLRFVPGEDGKLGVKMETSEAEAVFNLRTSLDKDVVVEDVAPEDLKDDPDCEDAYVSKFQSYQNPRLRKAFGEYDKLRDARERGDLHETMLDRREKAKADRYCK